MSFLDTLIEEYSNVVQGGQQTLAGFGENVSDVLTGAQDTVGDFVGDVTDVPGEVAGELAEPAAEAAMAPFEMAKWVGIAAVGGLVLDEFLNKGGVRKGILGG